ncbi:DNA-directed DNA polymerase eta rad30 [Allomyces arbusculus]|nr:DNA-directed DNA polymerase eta rad30 [Allomyces arbusculus]
MNQPAPDRAAILANSRGLRCIIHLDLDCFYCQVEQKRLGVPATVPLAVQQWQGLIAVNYAARAAGIQRHMTVTHARQKCPDIRFVHVATYNDTHPEPTYHANPTPKSHKVSLEPYRRASTQIFQIIARFAKSFERASIDEAYLDLTEDVVQRIVADPPRMVDETTVDFDWTVGDLGTVADANRESKTWGDYMLSVAAGITRDVRRAIWDELGFTCSAGIAHNKTLAKLCSALHKPNKQTIMRQISALDFLTDMPIAKIRSLGGKLGTQVETQLHVRTCGELRQFSLEDLQAQLDPALAHWLFNICRGICEQSVVTRSKTKSMMAAKSLRPPATSTQQLDQWLVILCGELFTRVRDDFDVYQRWPRQLVLNVRPTNGDDRSRSCAFPPRAHLLDSPDALVAKASALLAQFTNAVPCGAISLQCHGFEETDTADAMGKWMRKGNASSAAAAATIPDAPNAPFAASAPQPTGPAPPATAPAPAPTSFFASHAARISTSPPPPPPAAPTTTTAPAATAPARPQPPPPPAPSPATAPSTSSGGAWALLEKDRQQRVARSAASGGAKPKVVVGAAATTGGFALLERERQKRSGAATKQTKLSFTAGPAAAAKRKSGSVDAVATLLGSPSKSKGESSGEPDGKRRRIAFLPAESDSESNDGEGVEVGEPAKVPEVGASSSSPAHEGQDADTNEEAGMATCPRCGEPFPAPWLQEHLDWHMAADLSQIPN